ncbi:hypothetical protein Tco_1395256 [Tanacetum coccineum]
MDSLMSSQANQPYSPLNCINLDMYFEQLLNTQEYYRSQEYSMGQGLAHGSAHSSALVNDDDSSPVEEISPIKKPSKRPLRANAKKNDDKDKESPKDWTKVKEIALCQAWCDVSENIEKGNSMKVKVGKRGKKNQRLQKPPGSTSVGFNLNDDANEYEEAREHRPMGRDVAKANKKSPASSHKGSSSFVNLVADKYIGIKSTK